MSKLMPYAKALIAAVLAVATLIAQIINQGDFDATGIITFLGGLATTFGVYQVRNSSYDVEATT